MSDETKYFFRNCFADGKNDFGMCEKWQKHYWKHKKEPKCGKGASQVSESAFAV